MLKLAALVRLALLAFSLYGYIHCFSKKVGVSFSYGVVFSAIACVMFFAGILNIMPLAVLAIFSAGIFLAVRSIVKKEKPTVLFSAGTIFFVVGMAIYCIFSHGRTFVHFDDFSHWATAVKLIIRNDRFPNFSDSNFMFTSYPLGSASFIYYTSKIVGISSEWFQFASQMLLMMGMAISLFEFGNKLQYILPAAVGAAILVCGNTGLEDLLVDTLLPLVGLSGILFCVKNKETLEGRLWYVMPYTIFLVSIKNSGVIFAVFIVLYAALCCLKNKRDYKAWGSLLLPPAAALVLWQQHVKLVFVNGMSSKHSMSIEKFNNIMTEKSHDEKLSIFKGVAEKTFSFDNGGIYIILASVIVWLIFRYVFKQSAKSQLELTVLSVVSYVSYQIGTLGMYLFSMPRAEALALAEYDRYHKTILIFIAGLLIAQVLLGVNKLPDIRKSQLLGVGITAAVVISLFFIVSPHSNFKNEQDSGILARSRLDYLIEEYDISEGGKYLVMYNDEGENSEIYLRFALRYLLDPEVLTMQSDKELEGIQTNQYDYIIAFEENERTQVYFENDSYEGAGPVVVLT